jgi:hypothetical protein
MDFFYDGQVRRYLTQFMRIMSNFSYKDAKGQLVRVPVRYGDMNRQVGQILKKNSENTIPSAPFIACYIKDLQFDRARMQDPTFVSKISIRERSYDEQGQEYLNTQGSNYTVERVMPTPYLATFAIDIWTTNTEQKLQLFEQIAVLFTPSLELQTTDNYIDWTSISVLTLTGQTWSSRSIPQGVEQDIDILSMTFESHVWITAPAKVKQLGIITKIITSAFTAAEGVISGADGNFDAILDSITADNIKTILTPGNFDLLVLNNVANLVPITSQGSAIVLEAPGTITSWRRLLDLYPGEFRAGLSQLRLMKDDGNEIVAFISLDPNDETKMVMNIDPDTIPSNTIISGRGTVDAIINPETFNPISTRAAGKRYLILEAIRSTAVDGPLAWQQGTGQGFSANANDIIEWSGTAWSVIFNSQAATAVTYITNSYTGVQYKWDLESWSKSFEGVYDKALWRLVL